MAMYRYCDKCNLEVSRGTILSTLCVDGAAHHLVDATGPAGEFLVVFLCFIL